MVGVEADVEVHDEAGDDTVIVAEDASLDGGDEAAVLLPPPPLPTLTGGVGCPAVVAAFKELAAKWFSTTFLMYRTCRSSLPVTFSALYGWPMYVSPNTTIVGPCHDISVIVLAMAINSFWPSGVTPAANADTSRFFCSTEFRIRVLNCK